ncbi:hypothetical protein DVH24_035361 [Malus domestica]|uniref:Uncharacterized protein n=1 Tax=Malus domestica TaxID=3750 RepID=A0A498J7E6_MALDO|nr:hypothetical protein DVH24_035361 [Malus domestica]
MGNLSNLLLLLILVSTPLDCHSWGWFSSSDKTYSSENPSGTKDASGGSVGKFSMDGLDDQKGIRLVENAKKKLVGSDSCWQNAYRHLFAGCSEIFALEDKRSRFAWHLSDCFQKDSGRPPFPSCDSKSAMHKCLKSLNDHEHKESFESKQASMFGALDKLFALHNAMLLESRIIKAFFIYSISIFVIYMFTSTKQTYTVRPWLYIGLCTTFLIEVAIIRFTVSDIGHQTWKINLFRSIFAVIALVQLIYAIFTYSMPFKRCRDYEVLNHQLLHKLIEKVNGMQRNQKLSWEADSDLNWSSWIDTNLPEDVDSSEDPDYLVPEEVGGNFITASTLKEYDLRQRLLH